MAEDTFTVMPHVYDVLLEAGSSVAIGGVTDRGQDLVVDGRLDGGFVVVGRNVTIGRAGHVRADVHGESVVVEGEVHGDVHGSEAILVKSSGSVRGQLIAPRVTLEDGSTFQGGVETRAVSLPRTRARL